MRPYWSERFGNAGSLHGFGQEAVAALDAARESVASAIGAEFREVIFTGSATEANNLALRGIGSGRRQKDTRTTATPRNMIVSAFEHESVRETARELAREGVRVITVPIKKSGAIDLRALRASLTRETVLVSVMYANNETGNIEPVREIADIVASFRKDHALGGGSPGPVFHTDATQAFQFLECNVRDIGADLMTISSHKIYGPKGAGALYVKKEIRDRLAPIVSGGGQEFSLRAGTENIPALVGFAEAVELAVRSRSPAARKASSLRDELWKGIRRAVPGAEKNGAPEARSSAASSCALLPNILNVFFPGWDAQDLLVRLDRAGVAASSGSACRARGNKPSYAIEALGYSAERANASIRFSVGRCTTRQDVLTAVRVLKNIVSERAR